MMESGKWKVKSGKRSYLTQIVFILPLSVLLLVSCAKQGYPSGGPKDVKPPKAVGNKPVNETRNFKAKQFFIEFDEYVVLKDADNNVLVSPPMKQKPEYTTRGMGVVVKLRDTLRENTTYLFQFKEAIADFTEGNVLPSYEYVFSTGTAMDTMMLAGQVLNARNGKPWDEILTVMGYRGDDTLPGLVTRTDKQGNFAFHYIPAGSYRIVALGDKNRDLQVGDDEAVAWDTLRYAATDSVDSNTLARLQISAPDRRAQRLLKAEFNRKGRITVSTLLPMQHPTLVGEPVEWRLNERRDTLNVWCLNELCDSVVLILTDEGLNDTLRLRYRAPRRGRGHNSLNQQPQQEPLMKTLCAGSSAYYDDLRLAFSTPVHATQDSLRAEIMNLKDSTVKLCDIVLDSSGLQARLATTLKSEENYRVRIADSLFADLYGHATDSLTFTLTPKDYGILTLHVDNQTGHPLVIEVLDSRDSVVMSRGLSIPTTLRFDHLPAGEYRLRAVIDLDSNGLWTTGNYRLGRQPEECLLYEKTLKLREKWEMEERWAVGASKEQPTSEKRKLRGKGGKIDAAPVGAIELKKND